MKISFLQVIPTHCDTRAASNDYSLFPYVYSFDAVAAGAKPPQFARIMESETKDVAVVAFKEQSYLSFHTENKTIRPCV